MRFQKIIASVFIILFVVSCNDSDEEEGFGLQISPEANYFSRKGGSIINFTVNVQSANELNRYRVTETIDEFSTKTIKDDRISGKFHSDWFDYVVPDSFDFGNHKIELLFSTFDNKGIEMKRVKIINVDITERLLTEYGGNTMYSSLSNQFDAYDILTGTPKYSSDSTSHIRDLTLKNPTDSLSKSWASSVPEIKFVRYNNFIYANATDIDVKTAYETGIKNDTIRNLREEDILLSKINNSYVAIKIAYVTDLNGNINDKYTFSIKR